MDIRTRIARRLRYTLHQTKARFRGLPDVVHAVRAESLTYLELSALADVYECAAALDRDRIDGIVIEAGCALGGSAIAIATAKPRARRFEIYDVFGMPPAPTAGDGADMHERYATVTSGMSAGIGGNVYYGYRGDLLPQVLASFRRHGIDPAAHDVHFVRGLLQQTLHVEEPVALAHIDCDRYESVRTCLERIAPKLAPGGRMILDDYDVWSGCRRAVDEFFRGRRADFALERHARLHAVRRH